MARAGISTLAVVDGKVVVAASISTAGTSDYTSMHATRLLKAMGGLDEKLDDASWIDEMFAGSGIAKPDEPKLEWLLNYTNLVLIERSARAAFRIVEGRRGMPAELQV